jgi:hypothetical protein
MVDERRLNLGFSFGNNRKYQSFARSKSTLDQQNHPKTTSQSKQIPPQNSNFSKQPKPTKPFTY